MSSWKAREKSGNRSPPNRVGRFTKTKAPSREYRLRGSSKAEESGRQIPQPTPLNGNCTPLCPLFWCNKRAYQPRRGSSGEKIVFCRWIGDECIGASCQYAGCKGNYLLPNGNCAWDKQRRHAATGEDLFLQFQEDVLDKRARDLLAKRTGNKFFEDY